MRLMVSHEAESPGRIPAGCFAITEPPGSLLERLAPKVRILATSFAET